MTIVDSDNESMTFTFTFCPPADQADDFWRKVAGIAAGIDDRNNGSHQTGYTRREAFVVCFHDEGFVDFQETAASLGTHIGGWSIDSNEFSRDDVMWADAERGES